MVVLHLLPPPSSRAASPPETPRKNTQQAPGTRRSAARACPELGPRRPRAGRGGSEKSEKGPGQPGTAAGPHSALWRSRDRPQPGSPPEAQSDLLSPRSCVPGPPPAPGAWRWDLRLPPLPMRPASSSPRGNARTPHRHHHHHRHHLPRLPPSLPSCLSFFPLSFPFSCFFLSFLSLSLFSFKISPLYKNNNARSLPKSQKGRRKKIKPAQGRCVRFQTCLSPSPKMYFKNQVWDQPFEARN